MSSRFNLTEWRGAEEEEEEEGVIIRLALSLSLSSLSPGHCDVDTGGCNAPHSPCCCSSLFLSLFFFSLLYLPWKKCDGFAVALRHVTFKEVTHTRNRRAPLWKQLVAAPTRPLLLWT